MTHQESEQQVDQMLSGLRQALTIALLEGRPFHVRYERPPREVTEPGDQWRQFVPSNRLTTIIDIELSSTSRTPEPAPDTPIERQAKQ